MVKDALKIPGDCRIKVGVANLVENILSVLRRFQAADFREFAIRLLTDQKSSIISL
jgi:hypothetical protein